LPVRPRPASGEPVFSYIRRLALANHLHPAHLRHYLKDPGTGGIRLGWLAALAGRPETSLRHALAGQQPPSGFPAGDRQKQPLPRTMRHPRDRRLPERATPLWCSFCSRGAGPAARLVAGPGVSICADCVAQCTQALAAKASPEIASWRDARASELLASLPRQQAIALQVETDIQDRIDTLRERGVSWENIGSALGVTRQAAWARFSGEP
jgi:ATP-dependent Clp protease ATP-binding subunit ClpX